MYSQFHKLVVNLYFSNEQALNYLALFMCHLKILMFVKLDRRLYSCALVLVLSVLEEVLADIKTTPVSVTISYWLDQVLKCFLETIVELLVVRSSLNLFCWLNLAPVRIKVLQVSMSKWFFNTCVFNSFRRV